MECLPLRVSFCLSAKIISDCFTFLLPMCWLSASICPSTVRLHLMFTHLNVAKTLVATVSCSFVGILSKPTRSFMFIRFKVCSEKVIPPNCTLSVPNQNLMPRAIAVHSNVKKHRKGPMVQRFPRVDYVLWLHQVKEKHPFSSLRLHFVSFYFGSLIWFFRTSRTWLF